MTPFKSGLLFLLVILVSVGVSLLLTLVMLWGGFFELPLTANVIFSELLVFIPTLLFACFSRADVMEVFRLRKVKIRTLLLTVIFVICLLPLTAALNSLTTLFSSNAGMEIGAEMMDEPHSLLEMLLVFALFGPLCEELAFRGVIYAGLRRSGRILAAIVIQGLMFGCMHLNINQMAYGAAVGIAFGLLAEATGSIWPSFLGHAMINGSSVIMAYQMSDELSAGGMDIPRETLLIIFVVYAILAIFFTALAILMLVVIARCEEGGEDRLKNMLHYRDLQVVGSDGGIYAVKRPHAVTVPTVIALVIAFVVMCIPIFVKI